MSSVTIEKIPVQSYIYKAKCPHCRLIVKGANENIVKYNLAKHLAYVEKLENKVADWDRTVEKRIARGVD